MERERAGCIATARCVGNGRQLLSPFATRPPPFTQCAHFPLPGLVWAAAPPYSERQGSGCTQATGDSFFGVPTHLSFFSLPGLGPFPQVLACVFGAFHWLPSRDEEDGGLVLRGWVIRAGVRVRWGAGDGARGRAPRSGLRRGGGGGLEQSHHTRGEVHTCHPLTLKCPRYGPTYIGEPPVLL